MKIIDRKEIDAKLIPNTFALELVFRCKIEKIYVYNVELEDGTIGALAGYFNRRENRIFITITNKLANGEIIEIGAVEVSEGQYGIHTDTLQGKEQVIDNYRAVIDELSLAKDEITNSSKEYGCFSGQDESVKGSTKFIMKTKEIKYEAPKEEEKKEETTEKKGFFAWIKSLLGID